MTEPLPLSVIDELVKSVSMTLKDIAKWRSIVKKLKSELEKQNIIEDDIIFDDFHSFLSGIKYKETPLSKTYSVYGVKLKVTIAHRHSGESIYGVDLVYEIPDTKIVLIQYKKSNQGRFFIDREQGGKLKKFCYYKCPGIKWQTAAWFPNESRIMPLCPCYYLLITEPNNSRIMMPYCVVNSILDAAQKGRSSASQDEFLRGFSQESFIEMFAKCWLGAVYASKESVNSIMEILLEKKHAVVHCIEGDALSH